MPLHIFVCIQMKNDMYMYLSVYRWKTSGAEAFLGSQPYLEIVLSANQNSTMRYALDMCTPPTSPLIRGKPGKFGVKDVSHVPATIPVCTHVVLCHCNLRVS